MSSYKEVLGFVWRSMRSQKRKFFAIFVLDSLAWPLDALLWPYILNLLIQTFGRFESDRSGAWDAIKWVLLGAVFLVIFVETASRLMGFLIAKEIPKLQTTIRMTMFDHIQHHSPHYFNERFAGSLANKMTDMTTQVELFIDQLFWPIIPAISTCLLGAVFLWFVNPIFSLVLVFWTIVHVGICLKFTGSITKFEQLHGLARTTLVGKIVDSLTNNFAVNLFYRFRQEKKIVELFQATEQKAAIEAKQYMEKVRCYTSIFYFFAIIIGIFGSVVYLWIQGLVTTGQVVQVYSTTWNFSMVLWNVGMAFPTLFQALGIMKQGYLPMKDENDLGDKPKARSLVIKEGEIVFNAVSFQYGEKKLFENKSLKIKGGEKVGLVGFSGAGKSTLINLILRFFPPKEGKVVIDGQNIAEVTLESLRRQIALIPQEPTLFHRTLAENIGYSNPDCSEEEIIHAAKLAHCDEFIQKKPQGYDTKVGERGTKLSGGEKQRIAIARAILAKAPILILDEATSALDSITERFIQDSLKHLMEGRTTIVIAHRLSTLSHLDRILVFKEGVIVEEGTHAELLSKKGLYAKMWSMQAGGFL